MDELHSKYLKNTLSPDDLIQLRENLDAMPDKELEQQMLDSWLTSEDVGEQVSVDRIHHIKSNVDTELWPANRVALFSKLLRVASVLLIPILVATSYYFYQKSTIVASSDMIITAGRGERVSIVLPDGTSVSINSESTLRYNPVSFNKDERKIVFDGEAFFDVTSNKKVPFIISTNSMELKVLGTKFNILSREYTETIEVSLLKGHVLLSSLVSKNTQELFPNQKALFQKSTGQFVVIKEKDSTSTAWMKGELIFHNQPLGDVIKTIETNYDVSFRFVDCDTINRDLFTGTFPVQNINEILEILQKSYGFEYNKVGKQIIVTCASK